MEVELLTKAPERDPLLESSMDTNTEHESAGENDDYQGVIESTMVNAELDALLDPDSDTDNSTQQEHLQQTSDSEQGATRRHEKKRKTRLDAKEPGYYKRLNNGKNTKRHLRARGKKTNWNKKITEHKGEINRLQ